MKILPWPNPLNGILRSLRRRKTINELSALPDHLLADIGLERDAIPAVVNSMLQSQAAASEHRPLSNTRGTTAENDLLLPSRV